MRLTTEAADSLTFVIAQGLAQVLRDNNIADPDGVKPDEKSTADEPMYGFYFELGTFMFYVQLTGPQPEIVS
jgi:hypothetical protein